MENPLSDTVAKRIGGAAYNVAQKYGADQDDVEQMITLAILERYIEEPEFLDNTPAYVVNWGVWRARDELSRQFKSYEDRVVSPTDDEDPIDLVETNPWNDVEFSQDVIEALNGMSDQCVAVACGLGAGFKVTEIVDELEISRGTVYNRIGELKEALRDLAA